MSWRRRQWWSDRIPPSRVVHQAGVHMRRTSGSRLDPLADAAGIASRPEGRRIAIRAGVQRRPVGDDLGLLNDRVEPVGRCSVRAAMAAPRRRCRDPGGVRCARNDRSACGASGPRRLGLPGMAGGSNPAATCPAPAAGARGGDRLPRRPRGLRLGRMVTRRPVAIRGARRRQRRACRATRRMGTDRVGPDVIALSAMRRPAPSSVSIMRPRYLAVVDRAALHGSAGV
jgi:hypothetical protein